MAVRGGDATNESGRFNESQRVGPAVAGLAVGVIVLDTKRSSLAVDSKRCPLAEPTNLGEGMGIELLRFPRAVEGLKLDFLAGAAAATAAPVS